MHIHLVTIYHRSGFNTYQEAARDGAAHEERPRAVRVSQPVPDELVLTPDIARELDLSRTRSAEAHTRTIQSTHRAADGAAQDGRVPAAEKALHPVLPDDCGERVPRVAIVPLRAHRKHG